MDRRCGPVIRSCHRDRRARATWRPGRGLAPAPADSTSRGRWRRQTRPIEREIWSWDPTHHIEHDHADQYCRGCSCARPMANVERHQVEHENTATFQGFCTSARERLATSVPDTPTVRIHTRSANQIGTAMNSRSWLAVHNSRGYFESLLNAPAPPRAGTRSARDEGGGPSLAKGSACHAEALSEGG